MNNTAVNMGAQMSLWGVSFPLVIYPLVGFLEKIVVLVLVFGRPSILFSIMVVLIYIPADSLPEFPFPYMYT
jgi:hypothetical protein